jgi:hypothetical protein
MDVIDHVQEIETILVSLSFLFYLLRKQFLTNSELVRNFSDTISHQQHIKILGRSMTE